MSQPSPLPENEAERLQALHEYHILDTLPESDYEDLVFLAAQICNAPIALISLLDAERQWFKARFGVEAEEMPRGDAFCAHAILKPDEMMVVPDTAQDTRFVDNPLVTGNPHVRFYAGAPVVVTTSKYSASADSPEAGVRPSAGFALGTVCVIDRVPRELTPAQERALGALARQVGNLLDLRLGRLLQERTNRQLQESERDLRESAKRLAESEQRLREAQAVAHIGSWEYDIATDKIAWSDEMFPLMGIDPVRGEPDFMTLRRRYHPEDRPVLIARAEKARQDGEPYEVDIRYLLDDGSIRWLHAHARGVKDPSTGQVVRLLGTMQDISDRKATEGRLQDLAENLRRSNEALGEFTSVASHDLKEPLRKIQTFSGRLKARLEKLGEVISPETTDYLDRIVTAATRMQALIEGLLELSRVSQQGSAGRREPVDLSAVASGVLSDLEARITRTGGHVDLGELPEVTADPLQMRQLLQNLIGNALKYHREGVPPRVEVGGERSNGTVTLQVRDNGIGFAPEYAERVFEAFERLEGRRYEGTGIGLAICRKIVEAHGGTIKAEGRPGEGATFTVQLPAAHATASA